VHLRHLRLQRSHILQTLQQTRGAIGGPNGAAVRLGLAWTTLISKMHRLGINRGRISALPGETKESALDSGGPPFERPREEWGPS
jgi:hypothetical protein